MILKKMIKSKNYSVINLLLSSIGIFFSYFYFGEKSFFYSVYNFVDIIKYGVLLCISIYFIYSIIYLLIKNIFRSKLLIIFQGLTFGLIIYLSYHFIIRFSDLSYYEIYRNFFDNKSFFTQVIFYFYPFFTSFVIFFIISNETQKKVGEFLMIVLIIINMLSFIGFLKFILTMITLLKMTTLHLVKVIKLIIQSKRKFFF